MREATADYRRRERRQYRQFRRERAIENFRYRLWRIASGPSGWRERTARLRFYARYRFERALDRSPDWAFNAVVSARKLRERRPNAPRIAALAALVVAIAAGGGTIFISAGPDGGPPAATAAAAVDASDAQGHSDAGEQARERSARAARLTGRRARQREVAARKRAARARRHRAILRKARLVQLRRNRAIARAERRAAKLDRAERVLAGTPTAPAAQAPKPAPAPAPPAPAPKPAPAPPKPAPAKPQGVAFDDEG
jgi:hypothetical protein